MAYKCNQPLPATWLISCNLDMSAKGGLPDLQGHALNVALVLMVELAAEGSSTYLVQGELQGGDRVVIAQVGRGDGRDG